MSTFSAGGIDVVSCSSSTVTETLSLYSDCCSVLWQSDSESLLLTAAAADKLSIILNWSHSAVQVILIVLR